MFLGRGGGGGGGGTGDEGAGWLDEAVVERALELLEAVAALPDMPRELTVFSLCSRWGRRDEEDGGREISELSVPPDMLADVEKWPDAAFFLSVYLLHCFLARVPSAPVLVHVDALTGAVSDARERRASGIQVRVWRCCERRSCRATRACIEPA